MSAGPFRLPDLGDRPKHIEVQGASRHPGEWMPCEAPERPIDEFTAFHDCCPLCLIAAKAADDRGELLPADGALVGWMTARLEEFGPAPRLGGVR